HDDVSVLPTPVFFYGLRDREETAVEIDRGKTLVIRLQGRTEPDEEGYCKVFFELSGQPRLIRIAKAGAAINVRAHPKVEEGAGNGVEVATRGRSPHHALPLAGEGQGERASDVKNLEHAKLLRSHQTDGELRMGYHRRAHRFLGMKFKRQKPVRPYIVDCVCH